MSSLAAWRLGGEDSSVGTPAPLPPQNGDGAAWNEVHVAICTVFGAFHILDDALPTIDGAICILDPVICILNRAFNSIDGAICTVIGVQSSAARVWNCDDSGLNSSQAAQKG